MLFYTQLVRVGWVACQRARQAARSARASPVSANVKLPESAEGNPPLLGILQSAVTALRHSTGSRR